MNGQNKQEENVFHERPKILAKQGYCGFKITGVKKHWNGAEVTARHSNGRRVRESGETLEEAYEKIIGAIDQIVDEQF